MRRAALALLMVLAACDGAAPPVGPAPTLGIAPACATNAPPSGYNGPVSPFTGPCAPLPMAAPRPAGTWDYSQGPPPRAVRRQ